MLPQSLRRLGVIIRWNLESLLARPRSALVAMVGFAGVVSVFVGVLSIQQGFRNASRSIGGEAIAMIMRNSATAELASVIKSADLSIIESAPGIARRDDRPLIAPELLVVVNVPKRGTDIEATVPMRGLHRNSLAVREGIKVTEGRMFTPGLNEIVVGRGAAEQYQGLRVGDSLRSGRHTWSVVGLFEANGGVHESEIWADGNVLQTAYERSNTYQAVYAKLSSPEALGALKHTLEADSRLAVRVRTEADYYRELGKFQSDFIATAGTVIALLMAGGAIFGAINMMHSAVAGRQREIGIFRALGFGRSGVLLALLVESTLIGVVGGLLGGLLTRAVLNGYQVSTVNFESFSQVVFAFSVTSDLIKEGIVLALLMGFIGGLPSALAAARAPIITSLRAG